MPVLTRSQARTRSPLADATSSRPTPPPPGWVSVSSSELPQQSSLERVIYCSDRAFGGRPSTLQEMRGPGSSNLQNRR